MDVVKIRTKKGRIITLLVEKKTDYQYIGKDKFGNDEIVNINNIESLQTIKKGVFSND